jgi:hypothetical protein
MAQDRFIYWESEAPTNEQVGQVLEDYLGSFAVKQTFERRRYTVLLVGKQSNPHRRVGPIIETPGGATFNLGAVWDEDGERWIEVFVSDDNVDVITRMADPATCALADGLTQLMARRWKGRLEHG